MSTQTTLPGAAESRTKSLSSLILSHITPGGIGSKSLKTWDFFPKVDVSITDSRGDGRFLTNIILAFYAFLLIAEFRSFYVLQPKYEFLVDPSLTKDNALQVNLDITVAMPCQYLRVDMLDRASTSLPLTFTKTNTTFNTLGATRLRSQAFGQVNVHQVIRDAKKSHQSVPQSIKSEDENPHVACRIHGTVRVNKVLGMMHITALGHGYFGTHTDHAFINFTHRIDHLSFGKDYPSIINPLDHTAELALSTWMKMDYFIAIVPTIYVENSFLWDWPILTNQYSVTDNVKVMDLESDTFPGIFFKYDIEPISIRITEKRGSSLCHFITRICGIIGGVFILMGMILNIYRWAGSLFGGSGRRRKDSQGAEGSFTPVLENA